MKKGHSALDNFIWSALNGPHSEYGDRTELACVYKHQYYRFAAVSENTPKAYKQLASIVEPERTIVIKGTGKKIEYPEWNHMDSSNVHIMILENQINVPDLPYEKVSVEYAEDLIALSRISPHTGELNIPKIEVGDYYGIKDQDRIVAIAGERMQLDGYSEVSGVVTHPDYRKRGYGGGLTLFKCDQVLVRGNTPVLGVFEDNLGAVRLYKKLGFSIHSTEPLDILQRTHINSDKL